MKFSIQRHTLHLGCLSLVYKKDESFVGKKEMEST
jgi:hypothetical protein